MLITNAYYKTKKAAPITIITINHYCIWTLHSFIHWFFPPTYLAKRMRIIFIVPMQWYCLCSFCISVLLFVRVQDGFILNLYGLGGQNTKDCYNEMSVHWKMQPFLTIIIGISCSSFQFYMLKVRHWQL